MSLQAPVGPRGGVLAETRQSSSAAWRAVSDPGQIIGTWRLVSWEIRYADRHATRPYGSRPQGLLLYTADGGMSANIAARSRQRLSRRNPREAPLRERARAFDTFFAYAGRYTLSDGKLRHEVMVATNPAMAGTLQLREARLRRGRLELSAAEPAAGSSPGRRHVLVWARTRASGGRTAAPGSRAKRSPSRTAT